MISKSACGNRRIFTMMLMCSILAAIPARSSEKENIRTYEADYPTVWKATVQSLVANGASINNQDKETGSIGTDWAILSQPSPISRGWRVKHDVLVEKISPKETQVALTLVFQFTTGLDRWFPASLDNSYTPVLQKAFFNNVYSVLNKAPANHQAELNLKQPSSDYFTSYGEFYGVTYDDAWLALCDHAKKSALTDDIEIKKEDKPAGRIEYVQLVRGKPGIEFVIALTSLSDAALSGVRVDCEMKIVGRGFKIREADVVNEFAMQMDAAQNATQTADIQPLGKEDVTPNNMSEDGQAQDIADRLKKLNGLKDKGLITDEEYQLKRDEILKTL